MRLIDYLLLAIVAVCAVIAWRVWRRAMKKGGCCGSGCLLSRLLHFGGCLFRGDRFDRHTVLDKAYALYDDPVAGVQTSGYDILLAVIDRQYLNHRLVYRRTVRYDECEDLILGFDRCALRNHDRRIEFFRNQDVARSAAAQYLVRIFECGAYAGSAGGLVDHAAQRFDGALFRVDRAVDELQLHFRHLLQRSVGRHLQQFFFVQREVDVHFRIVRYGGQRGGHARTYETSDTVRNFADHSV